MAENTDLCDYCGKRPGKISDGDLWLCEVCFKKIYSPLTNKEIKQLSQFVWSVINNRQNIKV